MKYFYLLCIFLLPSITFQLGLQAEGPPGGESGNNKKEILETLKDGAECYICHKKRGGYLKGIAPNRKRLPLKRYRIYHGNEEYVLYRGDIYQNNDKYLKKLEDFYSEAKEKFAKYEEEYNQQKNTTENAKKGLEEAEKELTDLKRHATDAAKRNCYVIGYHKLKRDSKAKIKDAKKALNDEEKKLEKLERKLRPQKRFFDNIHKLYAKYCDPEEETESSASEKDKSEDDEEISSNNDEDSSESVEIEDAEEIEGNLLQNGNFNKEDKHWTLRKAPGAGVITEPGNKNNKVLALPLKRGPELTQKIIMPSGVNSVDVSFRYKPGKDIKSDSEVFHVRIASREGSTGRSVSIPKENGWKEFSSTYTEKIAGQKSIKIILTGRKGEGTLLLDNICVKTN